LLVGQRTQISNAIRGLLGEFGVTIRAEANHIREFAKAVSLGSMPDLSEAAHEVVAALCNQLLGLHQEVLRIERQICASARSDHRIRLLKTIPGVGPITASAIVATIGSAKVFKSGRDLAAWIGLTPINKSSGGKERLGGISKKGDRYLRKLLVVGMTSRIAAVRAHPERSDPWVVKILQSKPPRVATVALANKTARIVWAVLTHEEPFRERVVA
jgi:transposase